MLQNPIYCGKIFIPAYKDEQECTIPATHESIISEELFEEVQMVLNGRKRKFSPKNTLKEELSLGGFLECRKCGTRLTGSASKGNGGDISIIIVQRVVMNGLKPRKPIMLLLRNWKECRLVKAE